jgi:hypothetical protein
MGKKIAGLLLADRSGSMISCKNSAQEAINGFFKERANSATSREEWALCEFDTSFDEVFGFTDITDVPGYVLKPRGSTALHDSIAKSVDKLAVYKKDKNKLRILVVSTDGFENASVEHNARTVKSILDRKREEGWQIIYLAANQDAILEGAKFGVGEESSLTYDTANSGVAMAAVSSYVTRGASGQGWGFTKDERKSAIQPQKMADINFDSVNHEDGSYV